jgi:hypothetical protein
MYIAPDIKYDCTLLSNLTEKSSNLLSTVENLVSHSDIERLLKKQVKMELHGLTTIYSIAKKSKNKEDIKFLV